MSHQLNFIYNDSDWVAPSEYPDLREQLDKLFHDIDEGKLDKTGTFYTAIKAVKDKYPKE